MGKGYDETKTTLDQVVMILGVSHECVCSAHVSSQRTRSNGTNSVQNGYHSSTMEIELHSHDVDAYLPASSLGSAPDELLLCFVHGLIQP